MNGQDLLRVVEMIHRDKNIDKDIVFEGIEQAIISATRKHFGEEAEVDVDINRESGDVAAAVDGDPLNADEIGDLLGRIAAQTAKQVMIQKIKEAERDSLYDEYSELRTQIVSGSVTRAEGGSVTVSLGKVEGFCPRSELIPGESYRVGDRIRAVIMEVRKAGNRVKIILSRNHAEFVRRLFELEIPEISDHVIKVRSIAREAGYRTKVAVSCDDPKIDCVGACVGVRGSRIKNVVNELGGDERIDIVRWNDALIVLVPNALQPAEVDDVLFCPMLGKVIVLVREDQLSLAIGKKGQNVRLASKLVGWDIHVMTQERLDEQMDQTMAEFAEVPDISDELAAELVGQGFFTFDDLSVIEPEQLAELGGLTEEQCDAIVAYADRESERIEEEERKAYQVRRAQAALERASEEEENRLRKEGLIADEPAPEQTEEAATSAEGEATPEATEAEATVEDSAETEADAEPETGDEVEAAAESETDGQAEAAEETSEVEAGEASEEVTELAAEAADGPPAETEEPTITETAAEDAESPDDEKKKTDDGTAA